MALNILWHSAPAFFPTGYGIQTNNFAKQIVKMGHKIVVSTTTLSPGILWEGILHVPGGNEKYGLDGLIEWSKRLPIDLIITLFDIWMCQEDIGAQIKAVGPDWAPIAPVDHDPIPLEVEQRLHHASYPLAMSPFAMREMKRIGLNPRYMPHGVDTKLFRPVARHKEIFNANGKFVAGIIARNSDLLDRKGFWPTFEAFGRFHEKHPDSRLYVHSLPSRIAGGLDLSAMASQCGFDLLAPDPWQYLANIPHDKMAEIYSTLDVFFMLTRGEGFCVPLIEAQACGTPVIVTDFTAPSDLVGAGWKIPISGKRYTPMNSYYAEPDVDKAVEALEEAYDMYKSGHLRSEMQDKAREFAKGFDFDIIAEKYLKPFLEEVEDRLRTDSKHVHKWAPTGLLVEEALCFPCLNGNCTAELSIHSSGRKTINRNGFADAMKKMPFDIEDNPHGGVAKIVMREMADQYDVDLQAGDVVVDVGAHVGIVSLYLANKCSDIKVYAYEPVPENFQRLLRNIETNKIENIVAINKAVTSDGRNIELCGDLEINSGEASIFGDGKTKIKSESVTLAQIFEEHEIEHCKLLKIDCEGAEYEILKSSSEILAKVDHLRGEFHEIEGKSMVELLEFCKEFVGDAVVWPFLEEGEHGKKAKKSNAGGGQKTGEQLSGGGVHNSKQRKKKSKRNKRRGKKR